MKRLLNFIALLLLLPALLMAEETPGKEDSYFSV